MEEASSGSTTAASKGLEELAIEGQKQLEVSVQSAHEALAALNELLSNPAMWSGGDNGSESGWLAIEEARQKYKAATTAVRNIVAAIFNHPQMRSLNSETANSDKKPDQAEIDRLHKQAGELREVGHCSARSTDVFMGCTCRKSSRRTTSSSS